MGRNNKHPRRNKLVSTRLNDEELSELMRVSVTTGKTLPQLLREALFGLLTEMEPGKQNPKSDQSAYVMAAH